MNLYNKGHEIIYIHAALPGLHGPPPSCMLQVYHVPDFLMFAVDHSIQTSAPVTERSKSVIETMLRKYMAPTLEAVMMFQDND
jgi:hypothetical protein